jgi:hypothetical protein
MNFSELKAEVVKALGNLHSSHPLYSDVGAWVNRAANRVVMKTIGNNGHKLNLVPELMTSWLSPITVAGTNYVTMPTDKIAIQEVYSFDTDTSPNLNLVASRKLNWISPSTFEVLTRTSAVVGYPNVWTRKGKRIYLHPTPSTDYLTYLHLYGIMREPEMTSDSDEPQMNELFHDTIVSQACAIGAGRLGWIDDAARFEASVDKDIAMAANITALEEAEIEATLRLADEVTRGDIS